MGQDETGTLSRLRTHRRELIDPKIAEHRGRLVKTTGDGLLVEFASVVHALRCAVAVQREMAERNANTPENDRIEFRIGIHQGDIIVEDGDIFGDGVNLAARLEALADPGGICVSARVQEDAAGKLDIVFDDAGEQALKNIARPVRVYRVGASAPTPFATKIGTAQPAALALPDKPSIAVLPFQNLSSDPEQEYFADGMVEDITTAIARLPWLFVIARNSSFTYKGKAVDVKQVGRELGVRYVLEGSVRKAGSRVRITGQLIDATTATHIWADRVEGSLDDIFELQDRVTSSVVGSIEPRLRQSEIERAIRRPSESLDAYDVYLRALAEFYKSTPDRWRAAISLLRQALEIDPSYAAAAGFVSYLRAWEFVLGGPLPPKDLDEAVRLARHAIDIGKDDPDALWMAGAALATLAGEHAIGMSAIDRALMLNPNCAQAWHHCGLVNYYANRPDAAIVGLERAMRLSPVDPHSYQFKCVLAMNLMLAGRYQEAMEWVDRSLHDRPNNQPSVRTKIALSGYLDRVEEAREWISRLNPALTITGVKRFLSKFLSPGTLAVWEEGYRRAGLPDE
jgi:adenylate cyclase